MSKNLRQSLLQRRNRVPEHQRWFISRHVAHHLSRWSKLKGHKNIACYLSVKGELPTKPLINALWRHGKKVYLPLLHNSGEPTLHFLPFTPSTRLVANRFGIPEPVYDAHLEMPAEQLDLVLMPLVGFDQYGSRMGMGGGFYDRSFAFTRHRKHRRKRPLLVGVAMQCQEVSQLERQPWDIPLDAVVTEQGVQSFS